ncbi:MAG: tyrosine-type recombinase/integrase [Armatimonadetes bacterium]|nr:tyrosine-type recombinase/integrase [Armatimonadota bacterium]
MARKRQQHGQLGREALEEFLDALALEGRSPHSIGAYRRDLERVLGEVAEPLEEVQPRDLRDIFRRQQQAGRSPSSINRAIGATRSFFRFLFEEGQLKTNPAQALRSIRLGPPLAPKHLTVPEVQRLLSLPDIETPTGRRDFAILMLLYNTGLRVGELCALNREDVRLPLEGWGALQVVGKGRRLHRLPVNRPAADALLAYLAERDDEGPALFLNRSHTRFSVRGIALLVNRYLRAADITDRSGPHVLRHTFATHALRANPNIRAVQELLGHAWVTTTQRYLHLEVEDLQAQVAGLPGN